MLTLQACASEVVRAKIAQAPDAASLTLPSSRERPVDPNVLERYARLPLAFEENRGQAPADTRFIARGPGYQVQLSSSAIAVGLVGNGKHDAADQLPIIRMRFIGARTDANATGVDRLVSTTNYFRGPDAAQQLTDIPNYSRVRFDEVYPALGLDGAATNLGQYYFDFSSAYGATAYLRTWHDYDNAPMPRITWAGDAKRDDKAPLGVAQK